VTYRLSNFYTVTIHTELHNVYFHDLICTICWFDFMNTSTNSEIDAINKFILYNSEATQSMGRIVRTKEEEMGK
jgi:hypothetical protein